MRHVLKLAYDGSRYFGWQSQSNGNTVQQTLEQALKKVLRQDLPVMGCGRTDTGVHAKEYYAHFDAEAPLPEDTEQLLYRLNNALPNDIAVYACFPVQEKFHARFSALSRKYEYHILRERDPFLNSRAYYRYGELDITAMEEGCRYLLTCKDFKSFSKSRTDVKTYLCDLMECYFEESGKLLILHVKADRFLRNMVRAMTGTLLDIGTGKLSREGLQAVMESGDRSHAGVSVPARGLYLTQISYPWEKYRINE